LELRLLGSYWNRAFIEVDHKSVVERVVEAGNLILPPGVNGMHNGSIGFISGLQGVNTLCPPQDFKEPGIIGSADFVSRIAENGVEGFKPTDLTRCEHYLVTYNVSCEFRHHRVKFRRV
jgi:hypothetical protein